MEAVNASWIMFVPIFAAAIAGVLFLLYLGSRARSRKIVGQLRAQYGENIGLLTGCGIIGTYSRVPGVLALLDDRIIYRSAITSERGEILLQSIADFRLEDTSDTTHRRARKYRNAKVLEITTTKGELRLFAIAKSKAPDWEKALYGARR